jgi:demethylspheroidene O-methyltransferase
VKAVSERMSRPRRPAADGIGERLRAWTVRLIGDPRFRRFASAFPPLRPIARREARAVFDICAGFVYSQVLLACVRLRVLDLLHEGPCAPEDLAAAAGLGTAESLRLLEAAAALGLARRRDDGRYSLGARGAVVRGDPGLVEMIEHHALVYRDLADPVALLRGETASGSLRRYWGYSRAADPTALGAEDVAAYSRLMALSQPPVAEEIVRAYPFGRHAQVLDIGGGEGAFLRVVARCHPELRLALFDLPAVAARARSAFAVDGLDARIEAHGGDFRSGPVPHGADLVTLIRVLHDHDDDAALQILRVARTALVPEGRILIGEPMADAPGAQTVGAAYFGFYLMAMGQGRARRPSEIAALLARAGFVDFAIHPTALPLRAAVATARLPKNVSST